jgi:low affinity Fe/Cu permease
VRESESPIILRMNQAFTRFAERIATAAGTPWAFVLAVGIISAWGLSGPLFGFSQQWQLVINSFTTIVTFLMVFVIQNTQNRDSRVLHLKLTELLRVGGSPLAAGLGHLNDTDLARLERAYREMRRRRSCGRNDRQSASIGAASCQEGEHLRS